MDSIVCIIVAIFAKLQIFGYYEANINLHAEGMIKYINIQIPEDVVLAAKIPRKRLKEEIKRELVVHLYREGILSLGAARKLAGMEKVDFLFFLGQRKIERHYDIDDYKKDLEQVAKWPQE